MDETFLGEKLELSRGQGWALETLSLKGWAEKEEMMKEKSKKIGKRSVPRPRHKHASGTECSTVSKLYFHSEVTMDLATWRALLALSEAVYMEQTSLG